MAALLVASSCGREPAFAIALRAGPGGHPTPSHCSRTSTARFNQAFYARFSGWITIATLQTGQRFTDSTRSSPWGQGSVESCAMSRASAADRRFRRPCQGRHNLFHPGPASRSWPASNLTRCRRAANKGMKLTKPEPYSDASQLIPGVRRTTAGPERLTVTSGSSTCVRTGNAGRASGRTRHPQRRSRPSFLRGPAPSQDRRRSRRLSVVCPPSELAIILRTPVAGHDVGLYGADVQAFAETTASRNVICTGPRDMGWAFSGR